MSEVDRFLLGGVSGAVAACAGCSVEVARPREYKMPDSDRYLREGSQMSKKMKLLIAYDGSECAETALDDLRRAGLAMDTEAIVLTVADVWGPPSLPAAYDRITSEIEREIRARAEELRRHVAQAVEEARLLAVSASQRIQSRFPSWAVNAEVCFGTPAWELIKKADEFQPDLLVIGSHGRTGLGRVFLGSVSQKVLNEARCSVRIARGQANADGSVVRVLVAMDGSPNAEAAAQAVAARHWPEDAEIRLIAADDPFNHPPRSYVPWDHAAQQPESGEETQQWISKVIEAPTTLLRAAGLNVSHAIRWGDARNVILEEAAEWKADSIFVGARGLGRFRRFLLGSVSSAVAARAHCSVEVVRVSK
jgi:nucleotide-binding universal stress UspA family protein